MRTDIYTHLSRQICIIDASANTFERWRSTTPLVSSSFPQGQAASLQQFVLFGEKVGELGKILNAEQTGLFTHEVLAELAAVPAIQWPPDMAALAQRVQERFSALRASGLADQTPTYFTYAGADGELQSPASVSQEANIASDAPEPAVKEANSAADATQSNLTRPLSFKEKAELVEALLACSAMANPELRDGVLEQLRQEITQLLVRHPRSDFDVLEIVDVCLGFPGGIEELIEVVRFFEGDSTEIRRVEDVIRRLKTAPGSASSGEPAQSSPALRSLSSEDKQDLVAALSQIDWMLAGSERDVLIRQLRPEIRNNIPFSPIPHVHIFNIIESCLRVDGGLEELVEVVRAFERDSTMMQQLDKVVGRLKSPRQPAADVPATTSASATTQVARPGLSLSANEKKELVAALLECPSMANGPERAVVLTQLRRELAADIAESSISDMHVTNIVEACLQVDGGLEELVEVVRAFEGDSEERRRLDEVVTRLMSPQERGTKAVPATPPRSVASIRIAPGAEIAESFRFDAWLNDQSVIHEMVGSPKEISESGFFERFVSEVRSIERQNNLPRELTFEFSLPVELLTVEVDHWRVATGSRRVRLGAAYSTVVRVLNRRSPRWADPDESWWRTWNDKWHVLSGGGGPIRREAIFYIRNPEEVQPKYLYDRLSHDMVACVALAYAPDPKTYQDMLEVMIEAGIPVALCLRRQVADAGKAGSVMEKLLLGGNLSDLPNRVREIRREADASLDDQHIGNHLTLLWDDPTQLPPFDRDDILWEPRAS
jgi:hypothetical protein